MNYEDYIGNVTTASVQTTQEDWSDYFKQQGSPVKPENTYGPKPTGRKVTAASYMNMGPEVYVRPSHEAQLQQQINKMQQQTVESRLAEQMREYNQSYMKKMEALDKATKKQDDKIVSVKPVDPTIEPKKEYVKPEVIVKDEQEKKPVDVENMNGDPSVIIPAEPEDKVDTPVTEEPVKTEEPEKIEIKLFPDEPEEPEEEQIPGISFDDEPVAEAEEPEIQDIIDQEPPEMEFIEASDDMFSGLTPAMINETAEEAEEEITEETATEEEFVELDGDNIIITPEDIIEKTEEKKPAKKKETAAKKKPVAKKKPAAKEKTAAKAKKTKKTKE